MNGRQLYKPDLDAQAKVLEALAAGHARGLREAEVAPTVLSDGERAARERGRARGREVLPFPHADPQLVADGLRDMLSMSEDRREARRRDVAYEDGVIEVLRERLAVLEAG